MGGLKTWATARDFFNSDSSYVSREYNVTKHNTLLHVWTYIFLYLSYDPLIETVWSMNGTVVLWMDQLQGWIKYFFSNHYRRGRNAKFGLLVENRTRYLMQHLLTFYAQHIPLFLSINLTWSIEGKLILHILIVSLCVLALVIWHSNLIFSGRIILSSMACLEQRDFRKSY